MALLLKKICVFLVGLLYENGSPSRTGLSALVLMIVPLLAVLILTAYLAATDKAFSFYKDFVETMLWMAAIGASLLGANKAILSKFAAPEGKPFIKNPGGESNETHL